MTRNLLFCIALQFAPVVVPAEYERHERFDSSIEKSCIDFEVSDLENYISKVNYTEIPTVEAMAAGFKCPVNALPFGALKSDWLRLLRLYDAQPAGSVLKEKLPRLYRILVLAYQTMHETSPVFNEERGRYTNDSVDLANSTSTTYESQPGTLFLSESQTVSIVSEFTRSQNSLESNNESTGTTSDQDERSLRNTRNTDDYDISKISYSQESTSNGEEGLKEANEITKYRTSESTKDFNNYSASTHVFIRKLKTNYITNDTEIATDGMKYLSSTSIVDTDTRKNYIKEKVLDIGEVSFTGRSNALDNVDGETNGTTKWIEEITITGRKGYLSTVDNDDKEEDLTNTTIGGNNIINETNILVLVTSDKEENVNARIKGTTDSIIPKEMIKRKDYFDTDNLTGSTGSTMENYEVIKYLGRTITTVPPNDITSVTSNYKDDVDPSGGNSRYYYTSLLPASRIYAGSAREETSRTTEGIPKDNGSRSISGEDYYSEFDSKYSPASSSFDELDVSGMKTVTDVSLADRQVSGENMTVPGDVESTAKESFTLAGIVPGVTRSKNIEFESSSGSTSSEASFKKEVTSPKWSTYESTDLSYSRMKTILSVRSRGTETDSSITGTFFSPVSKVTSSGLTGSDSVSRTSSISPNEAPDRSDVSTTSVPGLDEKVSEMVSNGIGYFTDNTGSTMSSLEFADKEFPLTVEGIRVGDVNQQTNETPGTRYEIATSKSFTKVKYVTSKDDSTTRSVEPEESVHPSTRSWKNILQRFKLNAKHPGFLDAFNPLGRNVTGTPHESKRDRHVLPFVLKKIPFRNVPRYQVTPPSILTYNVKRPASSSTLDENGEEVMFVLGGSPGIEVPLLTGKRSESNADTEKQYRWFLKEGGKLDEKERRVLQDLPERSIRIECKNEE